VQTRVKGERKHLIRKRTEKISRGGGNLQFKEGGRQAGGVKAWRLRGQEKGGIEMIDEVGEEMPGRALENAIDEKEKEGGNSAGGSRCRAGRGFRQTFRKRNAESRQQTAKCWRNTSV